MKDLHIDPNSGKIQIKNLELNIAHHCNLSCRRCSHLSPAANKYFMPPEQILKDLGLLAKYCQTRQVRLLGGEPLLHPELLQVIEAVRESGIGGIIRVVTNGILLNKMPELFWENVDQVQICLYPGVGIAPQQLKLFQQRATNFNVKLIIKYVNSFRESFSELGTGDKELIRRIFLTCQITHTWQCFTIHAGHFYRCSLSLLFPLYLPEMKLKDLPPDGLKLEESPLFSRRMQDFLRSDKPLAACEFCLGSVGKRFFPEQAAKVPFETRRSSAELLDRRFLKFYDVFGNRSFSPWLLKLLLPFRTAVGRATQLYRKE